MKQPKRILIIDDDDSIRALIGRILRINGYMVDSAETGREGIEKSNLNAYDLALIDRRLPDMDGTSLLTDLRSVAPGMVKIMLTGYSSPENRTEAFEKYADGYITKPVKIEDLLKTIKEGLDRQCNQFLNPK
ncbi:MAG TPA: response regulator [Terriglobales bacterium]|nr:response regulator [Terriglobales bacterium]